MKEKMSINLEEEERRCSRVCRSESNALRESAVSGFTLSFVFGLCVIFVSSMCSSIVLRCEIVQKFAWGRKHELRVVVEKAWLLRESRLGSAVGIDIGWQRGELLIDNIVRVWRYFVGSRNGSVDGEVRRIQGGSGDVKWRQ